MPLRRSALGSREFEREEGGRCESRSLVYWLRPRRRGGGFVGAGMEETGMRLLVVLRWEERGWEGASMVGGVETLEAGGRLDESIEGDSVQ